MMKQRVVFRIETFPGDGPLASWQEILAVMPDMERDRDGSYQAWSSREGFVTAQRAYIWAKTKPCPKDAFLELKASFLDMYAHPEKYPWKDDEPIEFVERQRINTTSRNR